MFKKNLLALATTAALAAATPSWAASFYLTIPISSRGTAPIGDVSVNLANGTLANALVGEPYSATVKNHLAVTGDEAFKLNSVGWNVSTGALPAGLNFNVTTGAITGTPTAPGANTFGITATYRGKADEGMFNLSVMEILLVLQNNTLPAGTIGAPYSAGLQNFLTVTGDQAFNGSNVGWSFTSGSLPAGLTLNATTGEISGIPTGPSSAPFVVSATYRGTAASGTYSLSVLDITVNLAAATLPEAVVNEAYSANLASNLAVANDAAFTPGTSQVNWTLSSGTLPPGLSLSAAGVVSGTPTAKNETGASFEIKASYKGKDGRQVYTIKVGRQLLNAVGIYTGYLHSCAILTGGSVKCWGSNEDGQRGTGEALSPTGTELVTVTGLTLPATSLALGYHHSCAVLTGGSVACWGRNVESQIGDGSTVMRKTPVIVPGLQSPVASLSAGYYHTCALHTNGTVSCWGYNGQGQIGDGSITNRASPNLVAGLSGAVQVSVGASHSCAALSSGEVKCWGYNSNGQLGDNSKVNRTAPVTVQGLAGPIKSLAGGGSHTCAVLNSGAAVCWGYNFFGQIGDGGTTDQVIPKSVHGLTSGVTSIASGYLHSCARLTDGTVKCWGSNSFGQLGTGDLVQRNTPTLVGGLSGVTSISGGTYHNCVFVSGGDAKCWGRNSQGQGGAGDLVDHTSPESVVP